MADQYSVDKATEVGRIFAIQKALCTLAEGLRIANPEAAQQTASILEGQHMVLSAGFDNSPANLKQAAEAMASEHNMVLSNVKMSLSEKNPFRP